MEFQINSAEIRSDIFLKWSYNQTEAERVTSISASSDAPVHEDLATAFQKLVPHFLLLTEMKGKAELVDAIELGNEVPEEIANKYKVTGFTTEEKNGETVVTISGVKFLNTGKKVKFATPKTKPTNTDADYEFYSELLGVIEEIRGEILEYMDGKQAERTQSEMDFDGFGDGEGFEPKIEEEMEKENAA